MSAALAAVWNELRETAVHLRPSTSSLREFTRDAWHVVEPAVPFKPNWHIDVICDHLEAVSRGDINQLIISIPPGHAKSLLVSVMWPAWMWTWNPYWRSIFGSYDRQLAHRDSVKARMLLESDWYRSEFNPNWEFSGDQNVKGYYRNSKMGERLSISVGTGTGHRAHAVIADDPINVSDRFSEAKINEAIDWWDKSMSSRFLDQAKAIRVIIAQRTVVNDLTGHALKQGGYEHLCLPSEFDPKRRAVTSLGVADPRKTAGELLFPKLFTPAVIAKAKIDLGSIDFAAQHQQLPVPAEGGIFKREWFQFYRKAQLPAVYHQLAQSWDMSFKDRKSSDFVVGDVWGRSGANCILLYHKREQMNFPRTRRALMDVTDLFPNATLKLVEDKANGPAIIADLRQTIPGLVAVDPGGDSKEARAHAVSPLVEAGNVWLPHPDEAPWIEEWLDEVCTFPRGQYDDRVDAMTQVLKRFKKAIDEWRRANATPVEETDRTEAATVAHERF